MFIFHWFIALCGLLSTASFGIAQTSGTYTTDECVYSKEEYCYGMVYTCQDDVECTNDGYSNDWYCSDPEAWERQVWQYQLEHRSFEHVSEEQPIGSKEFVWNTVECAYVRPCKETCDYSHYAQDYLCNVDLSVNPNPQFGMQYSATTAGTCWWDEVQSPPEP